MWTILYHSTEGSNLASVWTTTWTGYSHFALHATQGKTMKSRVGERCRRIRSHLGSKSKDEQQVIQSHFATLVRRRATAPTGVERRTLRYFRVVPRRRRGRREESEELYAEIRARTREHAHAQGHARTREHANAKTHTRTRTREHAHATMHT